uniref:NADH dehydrogenase subunit 2 n=1 Tax=Telonemida sp. TaxID=2652706 RepID=A0A5P8DJY4_9EUKA|nr:NADH dehydrogenase subunit 2 [Telonemida sp.]
MSFFSFFENDFIVVLPELFISIAIVFLLSYGVIYSTSEYYQCPALSINVSWLSFFVLGIAFLLNVNNSFSSMIIFNNLLIVDDFTKLVKTFVILSSMCCITMSLNYLQYQRINTFEYTLLVLLSTLGMLLLISSYDLLALYLAVELMSLSFYILAAYKRNSEFSGEAGLKYFILGAFSSGLLLFGSSMLYGFTGMTNFEDIAKLLVGMGALSTTVSYNGIVIGIVFISIALLFKVAAAPFHMWSPDVYEGSPTPVTAFFSTVPKLALIALFIRLFFYTFYDFLSVWQELFLVCAIISMVWGSLAALSQKRIKRLMAYSGIVNIGYMLIGIASGTITSIVGLLVYLLIYVVMTIGFFSFMLGLQNYKTKTLNVYLTDLTNIGKTNSVVALAVTLILFSMVGLPPLAGFFGKMYLFFAAMNSELYIVAILGVLSSVVAAFYYIRIIKLMYFENSKTFTLYKQIDICNAYVMGLSLLFLIVFFISSDAFLLSCHRIGLLLSL